MTTRTDARLAIDVATVALAMTLSGCSYNKFTTQEEAIKAQWAQVQNQLQRRNDLIPNLVETVKGYATHEETVFKDIADARSSAARGARRPRKRSQAANQQIAPRSAACSPWSRTIRTSRPTSSSTA